MTMEEFRELTDQEQAATLRQQGVFLADRFISGNRIYLFSLYGFYIELFHTLSELEHTGLRTLRVFQHTAALDVYLDNINLSDLLLHL